MSTRPSTTLTDSCRHGRPARRVRTSSDGQERATTVQRARGRFDPGLEFGPAHPSRGERYSEPRFGAGDDAVGRGDLYRPFHGCGRCPPRARETPAGSAGETRSEKAVVPGEVGGRLRRSPAGKVRRRGNGEARSLAQQPRAESGIGQRAQPQRLSAPSAIRSSVRSDISSSMPSFGCCSASQADAG